MSNTPNKRAPAGRAGAHPAVLSRSKTGPLVAPRLATSNTSPDLGRRQQASPRPFVNPPRDEATPPAKHLIGGNITPRSGARRARGGSTSTTPIDTPSGTPSSSRPASMIAGRDVFDQPSTPAGIGIAGAGLASHSRAGSTISNSGGASNAFRGVSPERSATSSSPMFFHASDARTAPPRPGAGVAPAPVKGPGFFYANGNLDTGPSSAPTSRDPSPVQQRPKFYYANGDPEAMRTPSPTASRPSPKLATFTPSARPVPPRSTSPLKEFENAERPPPQDRRASKSFSELRAVPTPPRPVSDDVSQELSRRTDSFTSASSVQHRKTASVDAPFAFSPPDLSALDTRSMTSEPRISDASSSFVLDPEPINSSANTFQPTLTSASEPMLIKPTSPISTPLISPTHSSLATIASSGAGDTSKLDHANALAAQARRERKVLDLEISNSSLLAINRTLEREMRKQKAELRRYKRLTSSGRLSLPAASSRAASGAFSVADSDASGAPTDLDPLSEEEELGSELSEDDFSDSPTSTPSPSSPAAQLRRERDSRRLQLDLQRHQALLADSQRMNQSLKRCLTWTEELIGEGRRALAYTVRVSEVRVGGRVLAEEDVPDGVELEQRRGLLSPGLHGDGQEYGWPVAGGGAADADAGDAAAEAAEPTSPLTRMDELLARHGVDVGARETAAT